MILSVSKLQGVRDILQQLGFEETWGGLWALQMKEQGTQYVIAWTTFVVEKGNRKVVWVDRYLVRLNLASIELQYVEPDQLPETLKEKMKEAETKIRQVIWL
ncbi:MAG TPA: hypothetical protein GX517_13390 [Alicyclobacillus sp.]|nr:hypothetical protein [Alicyclobacillus sp.]